MGGTWLVVGLAGKLGRFDSHLRAKDSAVVALAGYGLVKSEVVDATPEGAGGGVVG